MCSVLAHVERLIDTTYTSALSMVNQSMNTLVISLRECIFQFYGLHLGIFCEIC